MANLMRLLATCALSALLTACKPSDPGPLAGKWRIVEDKRVVIDFKPGESDTMGIVEAVDYDVLASQVIVTYKKGPMSGIPQEYLLTSPDTVTSPIGHLERVK